MSRASMTVSIILLLVATTVVLAAGISTFVLGLGDVDELADDRQQACEDQYGGDVTYIGTTDAVYGDSTPLCAAPNGTVYAAEGGAQ